MELCGAVETVMVGVPASLRQFIEQQIGQLPSAEQAVLEAASVVGAEFAAAAVAVAVECAVEKVEAGCDALLRRGQFVRPCGTVTWPDGTVVARYGFLHDLYRETFYDRVPMSRRIRWHERIGRRLETAYSPQTRQIAAELAVHFERGGDVERAVQYRRYAGDNALQRSAHQEAIGHLQGGLELLGTLPDTPQRLQQELLVRTLLGPALMATKGCGDLDVAHTYARAQALCQQVGETPQLFPVLWGLWQFANGKAQHQMARALGERLLSVAQQSHDPVLLLQAHHALWTTLLNCGELTAAYQHLEYGLELYSPEQHHADAMSYGIDDPGVCCRSCSAEVLWLLGYPERARQRSVEALALAQELAHPFSLVYALLDAAILHKLRREVQPAYQRAEAALALGTAHGFRHLATLSTMLQGWALSMQGQAEEGIARLEQGVAILETTGSAHLQPWYRAALAEAYRQVGRTDAGLTTLTEALTIVDATGERLLEAELYRLQGELFLHQDGPPTQQAATCFHQALAIARQQQGKREAAGELLAPIYHGFTEGFDTADLQEAKALLDALA